MGTDSTTEQPFALKTILLNKSDCKTFDIEPEAKGLLKYSVSADILGDEDSSYKEGETFILQINAELTGIQGKKDDEENVFKAAATVLGIFEIRNQQTYDHEQINNLIPTLGPIVYTSVVEHLIYLTRKMGFDSVTVPYDIDFNGLLEETKNKKKTG